MLMLPSLIKKAIGAEDLDYQVAPGLSEVPVAMYPELDLEGARVAFLLDGDDGGRKMCDALIEAGVPEGWIVTRGELTLENLLEPPSCRQVIATLINEAAGAERDTDDDLPQQPDAGSARGPRIMSGWERSRTSHCQEDAPAQVR